VTSLQPLQRGQHDDDGVDAHLEKDMTLSLTRPEALGSLERVVEEEYSMDPLTFPYVGHYWYYWAEEGDCVVTVTG
jgi:hypothetical protein